MATTNLFTFSLMIFSLTLLFLTILHNENLHKIDSDQNQNKSSSKTKFTLRSNTPRWYRFIAKKTNTKKIVKIGLLHDINGSSSSLLVDEKYKLYGEKEVEIVDVHFDRVSKDVKWSNLFPEWIDETLIDSSNNCPYIPMPDFENLEDLDVVANVPCGGGERHGRNFEDVLRLQVNLVVANLLVRSGNKGKNRPVFAVSVGYCGPMWEIFSCDELMWHEDNYWIYEPDLVRLEQKVFMPVGSCELAAPTLPKPGKQDMNTLSSSVTDKVAREAYVTVLHSSEDYVCGAIALAQSIIKSNTTKDLVLLADDCISINSLQGLRAAGWRIKNIKRIRNPYAVSGTYNEWNYSKLRIWQLTEYDKLIFVDSDFLILRNTDEFFVHPQLSVAGNNRYLFNSGFMLVEPSECTFRTLMKKRHNVASYNGGDQGFLNEMFKWWHRWPTKLNFLKDFNDMPDSVHEIVPEDVYALHYLGLKPWMCHRQEIDYDCNWDITENKRFASDYAYRIWWQLHDAMPNELRAHCVLTPEMEGRIPMHIVMPANDSRFSRS